MSLSKCILAACFFIGFAASGASPLDGAATAVGAAERLSMDLSLTLEYRRGSSEGELTVAGNLHLGPDNQLRYALKTDRQEVELFSNAQGRTLYLINEGSYRLLPPEPDRRSLIASMMSSLAAPACGWLSAFLHGGAPTPLSADWSEGVLDGQPVHEGLLKYPEYVLHATLTQDDPPVLRQFTMEFTEEAARKHLSAPNASLRLRTTCVNWKFNAPVPEAFFTFAPPPGVQQAKEGSPRKLSAEEQVGQPAPAFTLEGLDGNTVQLAQHLGRDIVVLDFWASWCGPCRKLMPLVEAAAERFKNNNVAVYAVNVRESAERVKSFLESAGLSLNVLLDKTGDTARRYQASGIPRVVVIDREGVIRYVQPGMHPQTDEILAREIQTLLEQQ